MHKREGRDQLNIRGQQQIPSSTSSIVILHSKNLQVEHAIRREEADVEEEEEEEESHEDARHL